MHDGMPYGRNQGQGQGHSREVDRQSPTGLISFIWFQNQGIMYLKCLYLRNRHGPDPSWRAPLLRHARLPASPSRRVKQYKHRLVG